MLVVVVYLCILVSNDIASMEAVLVCVVQIGSSDVLRAREFGICRGLHPHSSRAGFRRWTGTGSSEASEFQFQIQNLNAFQCHDVSPPEGMPRILLFGLRTADKTWNLCASDPDEMT